MNNWIDMHDTHLNEEELLQLSFKKVATRNSDEKLKDLYQNCRGSGGKKLPDSE